MSVKPEDLSGAEAARIAGLLDDYLRRLEAGEAPDADGFLRQHPEQEAALRPHLAVLEELHGAAHGLGTAEAAGAEVPTPPGVLGDFRILGEIGRGGMGIVYEARQISLDRRVALKVLPFASVLDRRHLRRFESEAQAVARLHHSHIVPVYAVGNERGVHYYAMQFIDGQPLSAVIGELRAPPTGANGAPESRPTRTLASDGSTGSRAFFDAVARLGAQAADALEHAHGQGIVHRDVKPSNLLVDDDGDVWVTDFGLARVDSDPGLTATGVLLGTLRYMSPEQARAAHAVVDQRTDVYSLGATLYELVTLRAAFPGEDPQDLLRRIAAEDPPAPRRLQARVPPELETVLLKAMAKEPADRYQSASQLADDLRRFVADHPVQARRPTLAQHVRKWARRHRELVAAGAVFLVLAVIGLALGLAQVWREKEAAEAARTEAEASFDQARRAVEQMLFRVGDEGLADVPGMAVLRRELLEDALAFYSEFLFDKPRDVRRRQEAARSWAAVARIREELELYPEALQAGQRAIELARELIAGDPENGPRRRDLASRLSATGVLLANMGRISEAEAMQVETYELYSELIASGANDPRDSYALALTHQNIGLLRCEQDRFQDAERELRAALRMLRAMAPLAGKPHAVKQNLALACSNLATILDGQGQLDEVSALLREAIAFQSELVEHGVGSFEMRRALAASHINLVMLSYDNPPPDLEANLRRGVELMEELVADLPSIPLYRATLADALHNLSVTVNELGRPRQDVEPPARRALELRQELVKSFPENATYRRNLARSHERLARISKQAAEPTEAEPHWRRVSDLLTELLAAAPSGAALRRSRAEALHELGEVLIELGRTDEARTVFEESLTEFDRLAAGGGDDARLWFMLGRLEVHLLRLSPGADREACSTRYTRLLGHRRATLRAMLAEGIRDVRLGTAYNDAAWLLATCPIKELCDATQAVKLAKRAIRQDRERGPWWNTLAAAHYRNGELEEAHHALQRAMELGDGGTGFDWVLLAMVRAGQGAPADAAQWYHRAVDWLERQSANDPELSALVAEAAGLLGL